jgi:hypothetical protein
MPEIAAFRSSSVMDSGARNLPIGYWRSVMVMRMRDDVQACASGVHRLDARFRESRRGLDQRQLLHRGSGVGVDVYDTRVLGEGASVQTLRTPPPYATGAPLRATVQNSIFQLSAGSGNPSRTSSTSASR